MTPRRDVIPTCPTCGRALTLLDTTGRATTPPYLCSPCVRGWWPAELEPDARKAWDPITRSHAAEALERIELRRAEDEHEQHERDALAAAPKPKGAK